MDPTHPALSPATLPSTPRPPGSANRDKGFQDVGVATVWGWPLSPGISTGPAGPTWLRGGGAKVPEPDGLFWAHPVAGHKPGEEYVDTGRQHWRWRPGRAGGKGLGLGNCPGDHPHF